MAVRNFDFSQIGSEEDLQAQELIPGGWYHTALQAVDEQPTSRKKEYIDGFRVDFAILDGNVAGQQGRTFSVVFFYPKSTSKDGGQFAQARLLRLFLAAGLNMTDAFGNANKAIDLQDLVAKQVVILLVENSFKGDNGEDIKSVKIGDKEMAIYHPRDPKVAEARVPLDQDWLKEVPGGHTPPVAATAAPAAVAATAAVAHQPSPEFSDL